MSSSDERTTETDERAMAAEPIHGWRTTPSDEKHPAATGMATTLYTEASTKLRRIPASDIQNKSIS